MLADEGNKKTVSNQQKRLAGKVAEQVALAETVKGKLEGKTLELFKKVGLNGRLFGTVTNAELAKELEGLGLSIERRIITLDTPIKSLGVFDVNVKLFKDVQATFKVKVSIDPKQAEELKKAAAKKPKAKKVEEKKEEGETAEAVEETQA